MLGKQRNEAEMNTDVYQLSMHDRERLSRGESPENANTIIGEHISIEGTVRAKEDLIIQGSLKGTMELDKHHVTIGHKGKVEADIKAQSITVSGKMNGNVSVHGKVEITKEADFTGQIKAKRIAIEEGAYINGSIEMQREEESKSDFKGKRPMDAIVVGEEKPNTTHAKQITIGK